MAAKGCFVEFCKRGHIKIEHGSGMSCKICVHKTQKEWYQNNRDRKLMESKMRYEKNKIAILERQSKANREHGSHRKYGWKIYGIINPDGSRFTIQDYNRAFQIQGGMCLGCGLHQSQIKRRLYSDHDHKTGFFRGLLCYKCNSILGWCNDNKKILEQLITYLK